MIEIAWILISMFTMALWVRERDSESKPAATSYVIVSFLMLIGGWLIALPVLIVGWLDQYLPKKKQTNE